MYLKIFNNTLYIFPKIDSKILSFLVQVPKSSNQRRTSTRLNQRLVTCVNFVTSARLSLMTLLFAPVVPLRGFSQRADTQFSAKKKWTACLAVSSKMSPLKRAPLGSTLSRFGMTTLGAVDTNHYYTRSRVSQRPVGVFRGRTERVKLVNEAPARPEVPPRTSLPSKSARRSWQRKPHGYWNQLENVERELLLVNAQLGHHGRRMLPRLADIKALGRGDLIAALMKHGGVKQVSVALRWARAPSGSVRRIRQVREKLYRRPAAYWKDVECVHCEMNAFIEEFGVRGVMPTRKQLYEFGRADLANAAMRHGGLRIIAKQMKLKGRNDVKPRGYWRDFSAVQDELVNFSNKYCAGVMPTADELLSKDLSSLVNAIAAHGGFPSVAERCGLKPRNVKKQGAPLLWDEARLRREYLSFLMTFYPQLAKERTMVGERQLRSHGRNDLSYAIGKFGGFAKLAKTLGLKKCVFRRKSNDDGDAGTF